MSEELWTATRKDGFVRVQAAATGQHIRWLSYRQEWLETYRGPQLEKGATITIRPLRVEVVEEKKKT